MCAKFTKLRIIIIINKISYTLFSVATMCLNVNLIFVGFLNATLLQQQHWIVQITKRFYFQHFFIFATIVVVCLSIYLFCCIPPLFIIINITYQHHQQQRIIFFKRNQGKLLILFFLYLFFILLSKVTLKVKIINAPTHHI